MGNEFHGNNLGRRRLQGFLPQLDEFYFTTPEKETFGQLQMHCSEFHE
jgi:hypothetical protein